MADSGYRPVVVLNMTSLFSKEMLIYSLFDVKLKKPARVSTIGYFFGVGIPLWIIMFAVLRVGIGPVPIAIAVGAPFGASVAMAKPIWNKRKFLDWLKVQIGFLGESKLFCDGWATEKPEDYILDNEILVSRRDDFKLLKELDNDGKKKIIRH